MSSGTGGGSSSHLTPNFHLTGQGQGIASINNSLSYYLSYQLFGHYTNYSSLSYAVEYQDPQDLSAHALIRYWAGQHCKREGYSVQEGGGGAACVAGVSGLNMNQQQNQNQQIQNQNLQSSIANASNIQSSNAQNFSTTKLWGSGNDSTNTTLNSGFGGINSIIGGGNNFESMGMSMTSRSQQIQQQNSTNYTSISQSQFGINTANSTLGNLNLNQNLLVHPEMTSRRMLELSAKKKRKLKERQRIALQHVKNKQLLVREQVETFIIRELTGEGELSSSLNGVSSGGGGSGGGGGRSSKRNVSSVSEENSSQTGPQSSTATNTSGPQSSTATNKKYGTVKNSLAEQRTTALVKRAVTLDGRCATPRDGACALLYDGQLYLVGGDKGGNKLMDLFIYKY